MMQSTCAGEGGKMVERWWKDGSCFIMFQPLTVRQWKSTTHAGQCWTPLKERHQRWSPRSASASARWPWPMPAIHAPAEFAQLRHVGCSPTESMVYHHLQWPLQRLSCRSCMLMRHQLHHRAWIQCACSDFDRSSQSKVAAKETWCQEFTWALQKNQNTCENCIDIQDVSIVSYFKQGFSGAGDDSGTRLPTLEGHAALKLPKAPVASQVPWAWIAWLWMEIARLLWRLLWRLGTNKLK